MTIGLIGLPFLAIGLVLAVEGLVLALAPSRIAELLEMIRNMPVEMRRNLGLAGMALGAALIWLAHGLGG
ncbi:hypothetical protein LX70_00752 [Defluviimonas denitrificans]|jgi:hypothetical protein|uniref:DUF2065 domain-containing protein n=1 Tax=Albidovulum denitrificans TaxID=404881 RepID=A0A2S8SDR3_9RHOB|nr:DUF2065 domain-containing protein [Defluviimonas denitrificans]PQV58933.1 hypothetical protein LX70_00752 [Defluviimonas denitrificans]